MKRSSNVTERRKYQRVIIRTPLHLNVPGESKQSPGLVVNASESGLLIQTFKDIPIGRRVLIEVLFPKGVKVATLHAIAEIVWKDISIWEDWEGFLYGLNFVEISDEDYDKLKRILSSQSNLEEVMFAGEFDHKERLVVKTKFA